VSPPPIIDAHARHRRSQLPPPFPCAAVIGRHPARVSRRMATTVDRVGVFAPSDVANGTTPGPASGQPAYSVLRPRKAT
jgi:hypothetical protein